MADTAADLQRRLEAWERLARDLDKENDELRRENEAFRKVVSARGLTVTLPGKVHKISTTVRVRVTDAPAPAEMCCGGTCVRAVCWIHGPQGGAGA